MDILIEIILDIGFELAAEGALNKSLPLWIRLILASVVGAFFFGAFILLIVIGLNVMGDKPLGGALIAGFGALMLALSVIKAIRLYRAKSE